MLLTTGTKVCRYDWQCWFPGLAISNDKVQTHFSNKMYGSNFIKQHLETVTVLNYQNNDCSLRKKFYGHH